MQIKWCSWVIVQKDDPEIEMNEGIDRVGNSSSSEGSTMSASDAETEKTSNLLNNLCLKMNKLCRLIKPNIITVQKDFFFCPPPPPSTAKILQDCQTL